MSTRPWHRFYPGEVPTSLDYPSYRLTDMLENTVSRFPDRPAIHFMGYTLRYRELLKLAKRFAGALQQLGLRPKDRVAVMLPNLPQYAIAYYGVLFAGGTVVQTNPLYTADELRYHLKDSGARVVVGLDLVYPQIKAVRDDPDSPIDHVILTGIKDYLPFVKKLLYPIAAKRNGTYRKVNPRAEKTLSFGSLVRSGGTLSTPQAEPDDVAVLQYTGGTTGFPKGVMLTHRNLTANVKQCEAWMFKTVPGEETMLTVVPMFHVYGMTVCMNYGVSIGAKLILIPKFDPDTLLKTIHRERPTLFPGAPTLYIAIINHPDLKNYDLSSIKACISGSAPLPADVQEKFEQLTGGCIVEGYGLSEASPVTHVNPLWGTSVNGSIGIPWPDTDAKVTDDEGEDLPLGEIGELWVRGPQVMAGYWNQPKETEAVLRDGWLRTGDMAYMDENGYFHIVDRKKDVIIAGGFKVYPREVEEALYKHPVVQECVVFGVPDPYRGETVKAVIVKKQDRSASPEQLDAFCRERLAAYKVPRLYEFRETLPKTIIGKVLRRTLIEEERKKNQEER